MELAATAMAAARSLGIVGYVETWAGVSAESEQREAALESPLRGLSQLRSRSQLEVANPAEELLRVDGLSSRVTLTVLSAVHKGRRLGRYQKPAHAPGTSASAFELHH